MAVFVQYPQMAFFLFVCTPGISSSSFFFINLFIYFCLHWVFVAACGLSLVVAGGGYSSL